MNKKSIFKFILIFVIVIALIGLVFAVSAGTVSVNSLDAEITIDETGDMTVKERWAVKFPPGKSVTFREIGYEKYDKRNPLYQSETNVANFDTNSVSVKVYNKDKQELSTEKYRVGYSFRFDRDEYGDLIPRSYNYETIFIHVYAGMESEMTFEYNYRITGAVTLYRDIAELNWKLFEYFPTKITKSAVIVNLPTKLAEPDSVWGHGLSRGMIFSDPTKKQVRFDMNKIKKGELLEFRILMEPDVFSVRPANNLDVDMFNRINDYETKLAIETNRRITVAQVIYYGTYVMLLAMAVFTYIAYVKYDKELQPQFTGKYYRELPADYSPAEMSYLYYFRKVNNEDVTATLLDLIRRKYLILDTAGERVSSKKPDFKIMINPEQSDFSTLLTHERHVIDWFVKTCGNGKEVSIKEIEKYPEKSYDNAQRFNRMANTFVRLAKEAGKKHDFFDAGLSRQKQKLYSVILIPLTYLFISFMTGVIYQISNIFAIIASLAVMIIFGIYVSTIDRRSVKGNEEYAMWKAFREFLLDFGRMKDYPMPGVVVWEHYLVYATSLKIADQVMKQLEVKLPSEQMDIQNSTYMHFGYRYHGFHLGYTLGRINTSLTTARTNMNSTILAHHAQKVGSFTKGGGSGRGGGFSGGRSFGGGGGGFRVR
ncbi:MAG: DUF2207 domain-containing protein [Bacilli bacterium]|nr:DUF2207 domain-containing protein [Bacilli bacterium]